MAAGKATLIGKSVQLPYPPTTFLAVGCARAREKVARSSEVGPGALQTDVLLDPAGEAPPILNGVGED